MCSMHHKRDESGHSCHSISRWCQELLVRYLSHQIPLPETRADFGLVRYWQKVPDREERSFEESLESKWNVWHGNVEEVSPDWKC